jgi:hypothetical protein
MRVLKATIYTCGTAIAAPGDEASVNVLGHLRGVLELQSARHVDLS